MTEPQNAATAAAGDAGIEFRLVHYGEVRGAEAAAEARGVPLGSLVKTLVVRVDEGDYVLVCIPGTGRLDYKALRSLLGIRRLTMPDPEEAFEATGYVRGTITPFGAGRWPVIVDSALVELAEVSLGAGEQQWALHCSGPDLVTATGATVAGVVS